MPKADFLTGVFLILFSLYVVFESWRMPRLEHLKVHPLSVPGIVPGFLGLVIFIFGLILLIRSIRKGGHRLKFSWAAGKKLLRNPGNQRLLLTAILCIGYAGFFIGRIPYWMATGAFIFTFILLFEWESEIPWRQQMKRLLASFLIAVITTTAITCVFERLFLVTLP